MDTDAAVYLGTDRSTVSNGGCSSPRTSAGLFDGFEIYALFLTVGFALHQLLDAAQYAQFPRCAGYVLATTVFGWATGGVIGGIIADYIGRKRTDAGDPRLFADHRIERHCVELGIVRDIAFSGRHGYWLGMGNGGVAGLRVVAGPRARQGWRIVAKRRRDRKLSCFRGLAVDRRVGPNAWRWIP